MKNHTSAAFSALFAFSAIIAPLSAQTTAKWTGENGVWTDVSKWSTTTRYPNNGQPSPSNTYNATIDNGATVTLNIDLTLAQLNLLNGVLLSDAARTITAPILIDQVTFSGAGVKTLAGITTLGASGRGDSLLTLGSGTEVRNTGSFNQARIPDDNSYGNISLSNNGITATTIFRNATGATFTSAAGTAAAGGDLRIYGDSADRNRFVNDGTFLKTGAGITTIEAVAFANNGIVQVTDGRLELSGYYQGSTGSITSSGTGIAVFRDITLPSNAGVVLNGRVAFPIIRGAGTLTLGGTYDIANDADFSTDNELNSAKIVNNGAAKLSATADKTNSLNLNGNSVSWTNAPGASLELAGNSSITVGAFTNPVGIINQAEATLIKSGLGTSSSITVNVKNDGAIHVKSGSLAFNNGYELTGNGSVTADAGARVTFDVSIPGNTTQTLNGRVAFPVIRGAGTLTLGGTYDIANDADFSTDNELRTAKIMNNGAAKLSATADKTNSLNLNGNSVSWTNAPGASLELAGNSSITIGAFTNPVGIINQAGATLIKSGPGTSSSITVNVKNDGAIHVKSGSLAFNNSYELTGNGSVTADAGARVTFDVSIPGNTTQTLNGRVAFPIIRGAGTLTLGGTYDIANDADFSTDNELRTAKIVNNGAAKLSATANKTNSLNLNGNSVSWTNAPGASLELAGNSSITVGAFTNPVGIINQAGATLIKSGLGTSSSIDVAIINSGTAELVSGNLKFGSTLQLTGTSRIVLTLTNEAPVDGLISVSGLLTYDGALEITLGGSLVPKIGDTFALFKANGGHGGTFDSVLVSGGYKATFSAATGNVTFTAVPEPTALGLLGFAGVCAGLWRLRLAKSPGRRRAG